MKLPRPWRIVSSLFPILSWSKNYSTEDAIGDLIAGITVALTLIPQAIAYASLAGLESQYGLYASLTGGFVYAVMGTIPQINTGPTALLSLLTFTYTHDTNPDFAVLFCFLSGIVVIIAGVAQLGFLVEFVSLPVVSGFTSATAVTIASSQIKGLLGLKFSSESFTETWKGVYEHIGETRLYDSLLSLGCCILLIGMKALKDIRFHSEDEKRGRNAVLQRSLWFTGVARNAVVVLLATAIAYFIHKDENDPFYLTGKVTPGLPTPQPPPFTTTLGDIVYSPWQMISHLGLGILILPLIAIISNVAVSKAFVKDKKLDATQEIIALGVCGIVGSFFRSFPVNGSFTRSAVSDASGVRSPAAGIVTGTIVILTLILLTPYFYFIPRAVLASVIICAVLSLVDLDIVKRLWTINRLDLIPLFGTFICCLALGVEMGLICGVGIDVLLLLCYHARPPLETDFVDDGNLPPHYVIHPVGGLHFAGTEQVRVKLTNLRTNQRVTRNDNTNNLKSSNVIHTVDTNLNMNVESNNFNDSAIEINGASDNVTNGDKTGRKSDITIISGVFENGRIVATRSSTNILVVHCDSLHRLDYTCLQGIKTVVNDWQRNGHVVWCDVRPRIQQQLCGTLPDQLCCTSLELPHVLTNLVVTETQLTGTATSAL